MFVTLPVTWAWCSENPTEVVSHPAQGCHWENFWFGSMRLYCLMCFCFVFYNLLWRLDCILYFTLKFYNSRWLKALKIWFWQLCKLPACSSLFLSCPIQVIFLTVTSRALASKSNPISPTAAESSPTSPLPSAYVIIGKASTDWMLTMAQALSAVLYMDWVFTKTLGDRNHLNPFKDEETESQSSEVIFQVHTASILLNPNPKFYLA